MNIMKKMNERILGRFGALFEGAEPTKASPVATGMDGHLTNITKKQTNKQFILPDRYGFKTCEKLCNTLSWSEEHHM